MENIRDDVISYRDMCDAEKVQTLQRGMNFRLDPHYSVVLMSRRSGAPYSDQILDDGVTLEYEGHDIPKIYGKNPKTEDQPASLPSGKFTQNGLFVNSINKYRSENGKPELVKVYEKIFSGVWSLKGYFDLINYKVVNDGKRNVFKFILKLSERENSYSNKIELLHTRLIPSEVKREVWKRDQGKCVICGDTKNLHFDHELPFSKGGTSLSVNNIRLLCLKHNLQKSNKIE